MSTVRVNRNWLSSDFLNFPLRRNITLLSWKLSLNWQVVLASAFCIFSRLWLIIKHGFRVAEHFNCAISKLLLSSSEGETRKARLFCQQWNSSFLPRLLIKCSFVAKVTQCKDPKDDPLCVNPPTRWFPRAAPDENQSLHYSPQGHFLKLRAMKTQTVYKRCLFYLIFVFLIYYKILYQKEYVFDDK